MKKIRNDTMESQLLLPSESQTKADLKTVFMKIWIELACLSAIFFITFMLFPSIVFQKAHVIVPGRIDWCIFYVNLSFNMSDFIGRLVASLRHEYSR